MTIGGTNLYLCIRLDAIISGLRLDVVSAFHFIRGIFATLTILVGGLLSVTHFPNYTAAAGAGTGLLGAEKYFLCFKEFQRSN